MTEPERGHPSEPGASLFSFPYGTPFSESEAILAAGDLTEREVGTGEYAEAENELIAWLEANFLPGELGRLSRACSALMTCCREARPRV